MNNMLDPLIQATLHNPPRTTVDHFPCAMISHVHGNIPSYMQTYPTKDKVRLCSEMPRRLVGHSINTVIFPT